jgi:hypothetical protein
MVVLEQLLAHVLQPQRKMAKMEFRMTFYYVAGSWPKHQHALPQWNNPWSSAGDGGVRKRIKGVVERKLELLESEQLNLPVVGVVVRKLGLRREVEFEAVACCPNRISADQCNLDIFLVANSPENTQTIKTYNQQSFRNAQCEGPPCLSLQHVLSFKECGLLEMETTEAFFCIIIHRDWRSLGAI